MVSSCFRIGDHSLLRQDWVVVLLRNSNVKITCRSLLGERSNQGVVNTMGSVLHGRKIPAVWRRRRDWAVSAVLLMIFLVVSIFKIHCALHMASWSPQTPACHWTSSHCVSLTIRMAKFIVCQLYMSCTVVVYFWHQIPNFYKKLARQIFSA